MIFDLFKDKSLDYSSAYYQAQRSFEIDPKQNFIDVKNRLGLIGASTYAQIFFANQTRCKRFRRELDLHSQSRNALNHEHDVMIVLPPRGSLNQQIINRMLRQSLGLATSAGFAYVSHAQLNTDRVLSAAKRLQQMVLEKKKSGRKLILVSHSYGSAFVRVMLDNCKDSEVDHVKGWLNFSGLIFGSPLFHCSDRTRWVKGVKPWQRTFSSEQRYFRHNPKTHNVKTIHFLGMKNNETLSRYEVKMREHLRAWGPSDGLVPFAPYAKLEQTVVPVFEQGHLIDLSQMALSFVRSLSATVSTLPMPITGLERNSLPKDFLV